MKEYHVKQNEWEAIIGYNPEEGVWWGTIIGAQLSTGTLNIQAVRFFDRYEDNMHRKFITAIEDYKWIINNFGRG